MLKNTKIYDEETLIKFNINPEMYYRGIFCKIYIIKQKNIYNKESTLFNYNNLKEMYNQYNKIINYFREQFSKLEKTEQENKTTVLKHGNLPLKNIDFVKNKNAEVLQKQYDTISEIMNDYFLEKNKCQSIFDKFSKNLKDVKFQKHYNDSYDLINREFINYRNNINYKTKILENYFDQNSQISMINKIKNFEKMQKIVFMRHKKRIKLNIVGNSKENEFLQTTEKEY